MEITNELHDGLLAYLKRYRNDGLFGYNSQPLRFTLRRINRYDRLSEGYWFHGNENYLVISFWSGMDWQRRIPNISFGVNSEGYAFLLISTSDSEEKSNFIRQHLSEFINEQAQKYGYENQSWKAIAKLSSENFIADAIRILSSFLDNDKPKIDRVIELQESQERIGIGFIQEEEFQKALNNVLQYQQKQARNTAVNTLMNYDLSVGQLEVDNFKAINKIKLSFGAPINRQQGQWVFITGENGSGKSSLLQAIAIALQGNRDGNLLLHVPDPEKKEKFKIRAVLWPNGVDFKECIVKFDTIQPTDNFSGPQELFVAYGPSRLEIRSSSLKGTIDRLSKTYSLFHDDGYLLNIEEEIIRWMSVLNIKHSEEKINVEVSNTEGTLYKERLKTVKEIFFGRKNTFDGSHKYDGSMHLDNDDDGLLPDVKAFRFNGNLLEYQVLGRNSWMTLDKLSTGNRSIFAMIGDMILRFWNTDKYSKSHDPSEFGGIILIDEIDAHIHPKWQKSLVEQLEKNFPRVQFFVTSHSPIPFLGLKNAKNAMFLIVERDSNDNISVLKSDIDIRRLTPNNILTSPLFNFREMFSKGYNENIGFNPEDDYTEEQFYQMLNKKFANLSKELDNEEN